LRRGQGRRAAVRERSGEGPGERASSRNWDDARALALWRARRTSRRPIMPSKAVVSGGRPRPAASAWYDRMGCRYLAVLSPCTANEAAGAEGAALEEGRRPTLRGRSCATWRRGSNELPRPTWAADPFGSSSRGKAYAYAGRTMLLNGKCGDGHGRYHLLGMRPRDAPRSLSALLLLTARADGLLLQAGR
jgi:hypothetical protein